MNIQELFGQAITLYKSGRKDEADHCCHELIRIQPAFADAYNLSGLIARDKKDLKTAVKQFRKAIQIHDRSPVYFNNLGQSLNLMGKEDDALKALDKGLAIDPEFIPTLLQRGKIFKRKGDLGQAIICFEKILQKNPDHIAALNNLANVFQLQKKQTKALELYSRALQINPNAPELHFNLGNVFLHLGQSEEAETRFKTALQFNPSFHQAYVSLAQVYMQKGQDKPAKDCLLQSLKIHPNDHEALFLLANYYRSNGEVEKAVVYYQKCVSANPTHAMAFNNMGMTYFSIGMTLEAHQAFEKALALVPALGEALYGMAKLKESEKQYTDALSFFERALKQDLPFYIQVLFDYFLLKLRIAQWDTYEADVQSLKNHITEYLSDPRQNFQLSPLTLNYFPIEQQLHKAVAQKYASLLIAQMAGAKAACNFSYPVVREGEKIRIGYISADFRFHAVSMLLNQLFLYHDKTKFEVYAYSIVNNDDEYHRMFKEGADVFRDITRLSHEEAASVINKDQVHILVDLGGYTTYTRTQILALKPAPLQMHFMGYPDTMGGDFMDYIIADRLLIPEQDQQYYTEQIAYLEHAFFSSPFNTSEKKFSRQELGLPEDAFVYCCYNSYHKISPELFDVWMEILRRTDNTVLWLTKENETGAENLLRQAEQHGIGKDRIIFATRLPLEEYLAAYRCADLFLDTFNYSAGSTAVCALWGEVPVLTYAGTNNASRMGASIVRAAELDEFICNSRDEYLSKAVEYSRELNKIRTAKLHLKHHKRQLPLFNLSQAVHGMEQVFQHKLCN